MKGRRDDGVFRLAVFATTLLISVWSCSPVGSGKTQEPQITSEPEEIALGAVSGWVWLDADGDGIQDDAETGMANVDVRLQSSDQSYSDTFRTLQDGMFTFSEVPPGQFTLDFTPPGNLKLSPPHQGEDRTLDSDADQGGQTPAFTVQGGETVEDQDAGVTEPVVLIEPSATPLIYVPGGEYFIRGAFTQGAGDCMPNPADFDVPNLIMRVAGTDVELEQPGMHLNVGTYDPQTQVIEVSTGDGAGSEGYTIMLVGEMEFGATSYRYTTANGTCTWAAELAVVPE